MQLNDAEIDDFITCNAIPLRFSAGEFRRVLGEQAKLANSGGEVVALPKRAEPRPSGTGFAYVDARDYDDLYDHATDLARANGCYRARNAYLASIVKLERDTSPVAPRG